MIVCGNHTYTLDAVGTNEMKSSKKAEIFLSSIKLKIFILYESSDIILTFLLSREI